MLAIAWAVLFAPQLFARKLFVIGDAGSIRAFAEFSGARWHDQHDRTHWNPYIFAGLPATASLQDSRPQWLPDPLLGAFDAVHRLPGFPPLAIPLLLHLAGMIAMAALARALWGAGTLAMVWAGLAWGLLPNQLVPFAFGQDWLTMSSSLMPVVLLGVLRSAAASAVRERLVAALALSLAIACLGLAAHPQIILLTLPLAAAFALERVSAQRRPRALLDMAAAAVLGGVMSAAVLWPAHFYNAHTVRGGGGGVSLAEIGAWSAGLPDLVSLAWPWAAGFGNRTYWGGLHATDFPQFAGLGVLVLAGFGLGRRDANGRAAALFAIAAGVAVLLSLGLRLGPLYLALQHVPLWSSIRVAIRTLIVAQLAFALLSARGLERLCESSGANARRGLQAAAAIAVAGVLGGLLLRWGVFGGLYAQAVSAARPELDAATIAEAVRRAAFDLGLRAVLLAALVATPALCTMRGSRRTRAAVLLWLALDLGTVSVPFLVHATGSRTRLEHPPAPVIVQLAAAVRAPRVLDAGRERMFSNDWIRWRVRALAGNHPAVPRAWGDLSDAHLFNSPAVLRALAIGLVGGAGATNPDTSRFLRAGSEADGTPVWAMRGALPRIYAIPAVHHLPDDGTVLAALGSREFDPGHDAFTTDDAIAGGYATASIHGLRDEPDHLAFETTTTGPAFVVIADTWFPGWRATLDGAPLEIHRVQHLLRGVVVPAGTHRIALEYEPEGWRAGVAVAWAGWIAWLVLCAALLLTARRVRAVAASA